MINVLDVKPNIVSSNLNGYIIGVYGAPGCGKTSTFVKSPKSLLIATEAGYKTIPGVKAIDVKTWSDFLTVVAQLKKPQAMEMYDTIIIDTLDNLAFSAIEDICSRAGVSALGDIPWGGGYSQLEASFRKTFKDLSERYGLIIIAHPNQKQEDLEDGEKNRYWDLAVNKKVKSIAVGLMDMLIFVERNRQHGVSSIAHFVASESWEAKTRFNNIVPSIDLSYDNIVKAINDAVGASAVSTVERNITETATLSMEDFETFKQKLSERANELVGKIGLEPVKEKITFFLGKQLAITDVADYEKMKALQTEFETM